MFLVKLYVEGDFNDADYSTTSVDIELDRKLLTDDEPFKSDILNTITVKEFLNMLIKVLKKTDCAFYRGEDFSLLNNFCKEYNINSEDQDDLHDVIFSYLPLYGEYMPAHTVHSIFYTPLDAITTLL